MHFNGKTPMGKSERILERLTWLLLAALCAFVVVSELG